MGGYPSTCCFLRVSHLVPGKLFASARFVSFLVCRPPIWGYVSPLTLLPAILRSLDAFRSCSFFWTLRDQVSGFAPNGMPRQGLQHGVILALRRYEPEP